MDLLANPDVKITFTVNRFLSVTQGTMLTSGPNPDVTSTLVQDSTGRVRQLSNSSFEVSGGDPQGNNPFVLQLEVLPADAYAAVNVIIRNVHNLSEGGQIPWDQVVVGNGMNDNKITLRDRVPLPAGTQAIAYEIYILIKPKYPGAGYPVGDVGLIDPLWTNR